MGKARQKTQHKEEKDGATQKLKDTIRRLESDIRKLKSEVKTYELAFEKNIAFLKDKTKDLTLKDLIKGAKKEQSLLDIENTKEISMKEMAEKWKCKTCDHGVLRFVKIPRQDGTFYIRKCDNNKCKYSTRLKRYTDDVEIV